jgi:hypothetical protein
MADWAPPLLDEDSFAALAAIEAPSRPRPLPGSRRVTAETWLIDRSRDDVIAAYQASDAPIPPGATVAIEEGVLVIRAPFSTTCLLFSEASSGCRYALVPGPTLRVTGGGAQAPEGEFFTVVGIDESNLDGVPQLSLFAAPQVSGQPWVLLISQETEDEGGATSATCLKGTFADLQSGDADASAWANAPATFEKTPRGITARFTLGGSEVVVEARRTHSLREAFAAAGAFDPPARDSALQITCVTKREHSTLDQRIASVGGHDAAGKAWRMDVEELVTRIEAGEAYWMGEADAPIHIVIDTGTTDTKYPKAMVDGTNVLLHLPKCRALKG